MNFTNFTKESLESISKNDPEWLRKNRQKSFVLFNELPLERSELFKKYVDIEGVKWEEIELQNTKPGFPKNLGFLLNERTTLLQGNEIRNADALENGIVFTDIKSAIRDHESLVKNYFFDSLFNPENKMASFANSFFDSGYFLYIPDNTLLEEPLRIVNAIDSSTVYRNIVIVDKNSTLKLVEEFYSVPHEKQTLLSNVTSVHLKEGAHANIGSIQHFSDNVVSFVNKKAVLEKDSRLTSSAGFFGGFITFSRLDSMMKGSGSSSEDYEIVFGSGNQRYDITSNIIHRGVQTNGKVVAKGIFQDSSAGIFKGMIDINEEAKYANAYLAEHSMLLSKDAKSDAIPGLEISNNEVKATHSASVAQINEDELFYLMARGLNEDEAKKLIVLGFFDPLFRQIPFYQIKLALRSLFEIKWERQDITKMEEIMKKISFDELGEEKTAKDIFERHYKYR